jgi:RNA polymerase sigma-70 factor (ECF subfamily)
LAIPNEDVLIQKAAQGDNRAFEALVEAYEKSMFNLAFRLVPDKEDAMDIVQEVFLKAYQALPKFRGDSRFSTWIYRVCMNASLDHLRRKQRTQVFSLDEPIMLGESPITRDIRDDGDSVEDLVENRSLGDRVMKVLQDLEPVHRAVIILSDVRGFSYQEIADIMGVSIGTVKSRLHRARNMVRRLLPREQFVFPSVKSGEGGTTGELS